jgi:hypothetical protein
MMDAAALGAILRGAEHDLFRLETLDFYEPDREGYERWLAGDGLDEDSLAPWWDRLRAEKDRGLHRRWVRALRRPLSRYLAYECELYARNVQAGADIRILDLTGSASYIDRDYWMVDGNEFLAMYYGHGGAFEGARRVTSLAYAEHLGALSERLWSQAEPFKSWWPRHRSDRKAA